MKKEKEITIILLATMLAMLFLVSTSHATDTSSSNDEIETVETGENIRIIYYKNGHKEMFVTPSVDVNVGTSVTTSYVHIVPTSSLKPPDFTKIFKIIKLIVDLLGEGGVGCALLAWIIWNRIKSLRRNRPRDCYGVGT